MAVKSVVEIALEGSDKFERFQALYAKYEAALAKQPAAWKKATGATAEMGQQLQKMTAALLAQNQLHHDIAQEEKRQNEALGKSDRLWSSIGGKVKSVASTIGHVTLSLLKWGAILGGAGGAFSLYGIGRAIEGVSDQRRSAMGLGLSIGQQTSFGINFSRLLDTGQYLSWIAGMEQDVTKQAPFYSLTGGAPTGNTEADAMRMLMAMRRLARTTSLGMLGPEFSVFGLQMSPEDQRRLAGMGNSEFQQLVAGNRSDIAKTNVPDRLAKGWQDFLTQMRLAGKQIEKTFVVGLAPLQGPLTRLSGSIAHVLEVAMRKNGLLAKGVEGLADWLDKFNGKISKPEFLKNLEQFTSDIGVLAQAIHAVTSAIANPKLTAYSMGVGGPPSMMDAGLSQVKSQQFASYLSAVEKRYMLPAGVMSKLMMAESGGNPRAVNKQSGATGLFQLMPEYYKWRGVNPFDPVQEADAAGSLFGTYYAKYKGDLEKAVAAWGGMANPDALFAKFPKDWQSHLSQREIRNGLAREEYRVTGDPRFLIQINNNTGGSAVVSAAGLGAP